MKVIKNYLATKDLMLGLFALVVSSTAAFASQSQPSDKNIVVLDAAQQKAAGITIVILKPTALAELIPAPGEVISNAKLTTKVTPRVAAQVIKRHVQEGQHIKKGDILVTLSSVDMADVQGKLLLASQEWERVKELGKDAVSGKRYSEAQVAYQNSYSTALAYGMTESEIKDFLRTQKLSQTKGEFNLLAPRNGTASNINFSEGEFTEVGKPLLQIIDESTVWVDAKLPPDLVSSIKIGDKARVLSGERTLKGAVIQVHHQLDEITRTRGIRLDVVNTDDALHPGQFVNCQIEVGKTKPVLALPVGAVLRTSDGDWAAYIEKKPGEFQQVEVKLIKVIDNQAVIEGIPSGTRAVSEGAFFVHSELSKKDFDAHGH